ncbi:hypothetical protein [Gordonia crocea]|nr:hypothetical protein [Gordonia crocea]
MTKKLSSIALAVATTGAALVGTGVAAPDAAAQIAGGEYVYTAVTKTPYGSVPASQDATVRGNKLVSHSPTGPVVFTITPTATGGKFRLRDNVFNDSGISRHGPTVREPENELCHISHWSNKFLVGAPIVQRPGRRKVGSHGYQRSH